MTFLRSCLTLLALACFPALSGAAEADRFFDANLGDFPAELKAVQKAGKQGVLVMIEAEGCPYCRRMRQQVLNRDDVQAYFRKHFAIFSIDAFGSQPLTDFAGRETTEKDYARSLDIRGTPTFVIVGVDGRERVRFTGATKDAEEFMQLGRYVVAGRYKTMSFEQYLAAAKAVR